MLKQIEQATLRQALEDSQISLGFISFAGLKLKNTTDLPAIKTGIGVRPVIILATGNCMAMELARTVANHDLVTQDRTLELINATIKRGICRADMLHFDEQFNP